MRAAQNIKRKQKKAEKHNSKRRISLNVVIFRKTNQNAPSVNKNALLIFIV